MNRYLWYPCWLLIAFGVQASDMNPPSWRGEPGSTFQQWDFMFATGPDSRTTIRECSEVEFIVTEQGGQATPDVVVNPYEESTGICVEFKSLWFITKRLDWLQTYFGRDGIWKLESHRTFENFLNFIIPNAADNTNTSTIIQLQLIARSFRGDPVVTIQYPSNNELVDTKLDVYQEPSTIPLPEDWIHSTYLFKSPGCPRYESVFISPPAEGDIFLDSITIDTLCTENPDSILPPN